MSIICSGGGGVKFVIGPNSIFHSHCSARTQPFGSHSAAKYQLWNTGYLGVLCLKPLVWYSVWIEMLLRLNSEILCVQLTKAELPSRQRPWPPSASKGGSVCVNWFVVIWLIVTSFGDIHNSRIQSTVHRQKQECVVRGIVACFVKYLFPFSRIFRGESATDLICL